MPTPRSTLRETLADNVRRLRLERGLSQEAFADLVGLHRTYVSGVERSRFNVSLDNIERIAAALEVCADVLLRATS